MEWCSLCVYSECLERLCEWIPVTPGGLDQWVRNQGHASRRARRSVQRVICLFMPDSALESSSFHSTERDFASPYGLPAFILPIVRSFKHNYRQYGLISTLTDSTVLQHSYRQYGQLSTLTDSTVKQALLTESTVIQHSLPIVRSSKHPLPIVRSIKRPLPIVRSIKQSLPIVRSIEQSLPIVRSNENSSP